ncbi:prephenate dehydrogenase [Crenobacter intestini]|uniref:prephenate dehydrogenase n=1 Tax=Crenobacter intestini TaxID=2563443 RepID=A0A4T0UUE4_9NEIS|nr:prephenate dehydrogenase/arogenate dehydrogenase family protein [Crenobacter intestini]TIC82286.1 prephenate dehydrogenase/arogenate dehydrogenase family protein [Crenobacter intestini]
MQASIDTLVVVGVGLIGGSFALALRRAGRVRHVIGVGRSLANMQRALELGVVDEVSTELGDACARAGMVLLATPVGQMGALFGAMAPRLPEHTIVTDAGSTKGDVALLMREHLPGHLARCVPAHPIAGSDLSGAAAAQFGLYEGRRVVLTPLPESDDDAVATVRGLWQACGADVHEMGAHEHDSVFASVSHLPHLLAFAYVERIAARSDAERRFDFAATGFRDFTRIAGSHPEMWRDIALANRDALLGELDDYMAGLARLRGQLAGADGEAMQRTFERARDARTRWYQRFLRGQ